MTKEQQILKKITDLQLQMAESIENGEVEMGWVRHNIYEIENMIDSLANKND